MVLDLELTGDEMIVPTDTSDAIKAYIREIVSTCHESTPVEEILEKSAQYWQRLAEGEKLSAAVLSKLRMKCLSTSHRKEDLVPFRTVQSICDELQIPADAVARIADKIAPGQNLRDILTVDYNEFIVMACTLMGNHEKDRFSWVKALLQVYDETGLVSVSTQTFLPLFKFFERVDPTITDEAYNLLKKHAAKMEAGALQMTIQEFESFYEAYVMPLQYEAKQKSAAKLSRQPSSSTVVKSPKPSTPRSMSRQPSTPRSMNRQPSTPKAVDARLK